MLCSYEVKPKQKSSLAIYLFSFLWERKGFYLRSVAPSSPKPSPTPLHVRGGDIALLTQSVASLVNFDGVKFINLTSNFNVKR